MKYHNRNVSNLNKLADNTKAATFKWYQYCIDNGIEVLIYETIRTVEQQREYVRKGASQTMRSYHSRTGIRFCSNSVEWYRRLEWL